MRQSDKANIKHNSLQRQDISLALRWYPLISLLLQIITIIYLYYYRLLDHFSGYNISLDHFGPKLKMYLMRFRFWLLQFCGNCLFFGFALMGKSGFSQLNTILLCFRNHFAKFLSSMVGKIDSTHYTVLESTFIAAFSTQIYTITSPCERLMQLQYYSADCRQLT